MYQSYEVLDEYLKVRMKELQQEAVRQRLAAEVPSTGRPLRLRLADGLYALAARVEGQPRRSRHEGIALTA